MTQDRREPVFFIANLDNLTNDPWDRHNKSTGSPTELRSPQNALKRVRL